MISDQIAVGSSLSRIATIDAGRFIGVLAVILIHTVGPSHFSSAGPLSEYSSVLGNITDDLCRFAVPFFFMTSGYFLANAQSFTASAARVLRRIVPIYLFWTLLFLAIHPAAYHFLASPGFYPRLLLSGGTAQHLWFLPALIVNVLLVMALDRLARPELQFAIAFFLYLCGLFIGSYHEALFGAEPSELLLHIARDSPAFGLIFVLLGFRIGRSGVVLPIRTSIAILMIGITCQLVELASIRAANADAHQAFDYVLSTLVFGAGAFLTALSLSGAISDGRLVSYPAYLGRYSLGIYTVHPLFIEIFAFFVVPSTFAVRLAIAGLTAVSATLTVLGMARIRYLRNLVT